jgi:hypothetical protein
MGRSWKESQDVNQASGNVDQLMQQAAELHQEFEAELAAQETKIDPATSCPKQLFRPVVILDR